MISRVGDPPCIRSGVLCSGDLRVRQRAGPRRVLSGQSEGSIFRATHRRSPLRNGIDRNSVVAGFPPYGATARLIPSTHGPAWPAIARTECVAAAAAPQCTAGALEHFHLNARKVARPTLKVASTNSSYRLRTTAMFGSDRPARHLDYAPVLPRRPRAPSNSGSPWAFLPHHA